MATSRRRKEEREEGREEGWREVEREEESGVLRMRDEARRSHRRRRLGPRLICICRIPARARPMKEKSATPEVSAA